jgi:hypothetical protein
MEVGLDVEGITQATLALAMAVGWTSPELETDAKAETTIGRSGTANLKRGVLAGTSPSARVE